MQFDVRNLTSDEMEAAALISAQAFGAPMRFDIAPSAEKARALYPPSDYLGTFEDDELTAMTHIVPRTMRINGASLGFGAVSPVASSALHRRKGHAAALLRRALEQMRERGHVLSGLHTPHPALYRRYGWEIAGGQRTYEFNPKDLELSARPSQRGKLRYVTIEDWPRVAAIYDRYATASNGPFDRDELWWRNWVFTTWMGRIEGIVWQDDAGADAGYVLYIDPVEPDQDKTRIQVFDMCSLTGDAYLSLVTVLGQHDIRHHITMPAPLDDPLQLLFVDAERLQITERFNVMLRIVDVENALRARPLADASLNTDLTMAVTDASAPWNQGTYRLQAAEGRIMVARTSGEGELRLDAKVLAPVFNGYVTPSRAATAGLLHAASEDALRRADALFAVTHPPYFPDTY
jgi:predicted acetyltransferase